MNFLKTTAYGNNIQTMTDNMVCINWSASYFCLQATFLFLSMMLKKQKYS